MFCFISTKPVLLKQSFQKTQNAAISQHDNYSQHTYPEFDSVLAEGNSHESRLRQVKMGLDTRVNAVVPASTSKGSVRRTVSKDASVTSVHSLKHRKSLKSV